MIVKIQLTLVFCDLKKKLKWKQKKQKKQI